MTEHRFSHCNEEPVGAPYAKGSDTSREAAKHAAARIAEQRTEVYRAIIRAGSNGLTWDEIVVKLSISPTSNGRITELRDMGLICDSDRRRKTRRGRNATVWIATPLNTVRHAADKPTAITDSEPSTESSTQSNQVRTETPSAGGEVPAYDGAGAIFANPSDGGYV